MSRMIAERFSAYLKDDTGATAIEYAIIAASICLGIASIIQLMGVSLAGMYAAIAGFLA